MEQWAWAELEAQIDSHGVASVEFYLDQEDHETGENVRLEVTDISFEDDEIKVVLN